MLGWPHLLAILGVFIYEQKIDEVTFIFSFVEFRASFLSGRIAKKRANREHSNLWTGLSRWDLFPTTYGAG
jgi:hypothetical protein